MELSLSDIVLLLWDEMILLFFSNVSGLSRFIPMKDFLNEMLQTARVRLTRWYLLSHLLLEVGLLSLAPFSTVFKYWVFSVMVRERV